MIVFDSLSTSELTKIVGIQIERLAKRLSGRRLTLTVTPAAREWLALTGFDPVIVDLDEGADELTVRPAAAAAKVS